MNFRYLVLLVVVLVISSSCSKEERMARDDGLRQWMSENGKKKILCTTGMVRDIVQKVGGEYIETYTLIQGEHDPHSYQLVKGDDEKFLRADVIFYSGLGLEHGPNLNHFLEKNSKAYSLGDFILNKTPDKIIYMDTTIDPHVWMDVSLWSTCVPFIVKTLCMLAPEHKDEIKKNGDDLMRDLKCVHEDVLKILHTIPPKKRYLVTTHDAFNYFTKTYLADTVEVENGNWRNHCQAPEGLAPDSQLSTVDIHRLIDHIIAYNIFTIFAESNVSQDSIKKLVDAAEQKGHHVCIAKKPLFADSMGPKGSTADTYEKMIQYDAQTIANELKDSNDCSIKSK
ncbi:MAG: putative periplasmic solute binding family protein [Chlamydiia bacterium]|nr:putative periplasmic solute binding family protein [Chlamydiia bacterium]